MSEIQSRAAGPSHEASVAERSFPSALASDVNQVVTGVAGGVGSAVGTAVALARIVKGDDEPPSDGGGGNLA